jgi:uncharacterized protein (TIGR03118 family)
VKHKFALYFFCLLLAGSGLISGRAGAQTKAYRQTNLASSVAGAAPNDSQSLVDPWAITFLSGQPFFVAGNGSGVISALNSYGMQEGVVAVPVSLGSMSVSMPTGVASYDSGGFGLASAPLGYIVVTQGGTIASFYTPKGNIPLQATLLRDDSAAGAVYTALALLHPDCCAPFVAVANFNNGSILAFTSTFDLLDAPGSFVDPNLPAGYAPFGMQLIGSQLFIAYAVQDSAKRSQVTGAGNGIVDVFDAQGNFMRRFATGGSLNAPWGIALASANFGPFSGAILVGNSGDGTISAFDATTGNYLGQISDGDGNVIANPGIRGLTFRADGAADPNTLFFTAENGNGQGGLFAAITAGLVSSTRASAPVAAVNTSVMITATVDAGPSNPGMPSGTVAIADGGVPQGTAPLTDGVATFVLPDAGVGAHVLTVQYSGDAAFLPSSSQAQMQVAGMATSVTLAAPAKAVHGSPVTMTATMNSTGGIPAGNIVFQEGNIVLGSAPMNAMGIASLTVSNLAVGTHSLNASFAGAGAFAGSASATVTTDVTTAGPSFAVAASPGSITVSAGQSAPVMVTVTPSGGFMSNVALSCTSVPGITCTFVAETLATANGAASTTMMVNTASSVPRYGFLPNGGIGMGGVLCALALLALAIWRGGKFERGRVPVLATAALLAIFAFSLSMNGCGYGSSYTPPANPGSATLTVSGISGTMTQTATVSVTVQ